MNLFAIFKRRKKSVEQRIFETLDSNPKRELADTLKPRPDLRDRRFQNWDMNRRQRYLDAAFGVPQSLSRRGRERYAATSSPQGQSPRSAPAGFES